MEPRQACAIIVAGGHSRRLGRDKRRLRLWGDDQPTLLERTVALARRLCPEVLVVLNDPADWAGLPARLVPDAWPDAGPLGGIASGLRAAAPGAEWALVLAADLPLLSERLLAGLLAHPCAGEAVVPRQDDPSRIEPLLALYRRSCLAGLESYLAAGRRKATDWAAALDACWLDPPAWRRWDPAGWSFLNLNTPDQLDLARAHLQQRSGAL
ncbi:MAG TPA: molybdenum cofactor guanylyltransferase [Herpetosiphonaceae bacterium]